MNHDYIFYMDLEWRSKSEKISWMNRSNTAIQSKQHFKQYMEVATKVNDCTVFINSGYVKPQLAYEISFNHFNNNSIFY